MYNLERFLIAQEGEWEKAFGELVDGEKATHWMWYMFPQVAGLSISEKGSYYAINSLAEAKAYYENDILRKRLKTLTVLVKAHGSYVSLEDIFGSTDHKKFISCMTLFKHATQDRIFEEVLTLFNKEDDLYTLKVLGL